MTRQDTRTHQADTQEAEDAPLLSTLVYRSRATVPMEQAALQAILQGAQARNQAEKVTGLLVYDQGCFFQWLEGPAESIARIWDSLRRDTRHTDVEVLDTHPTRERFFADWDMRLAVRRDRDDQGANRFDEIAPHLVDSLYHSPDSAPEVLAGMSPSQMGSNSAAVTPHDTSAALREVLKTVVIPQIAARHGAARLLLPAADPRAAELAKLAIAADPQAAFDLVADLHRRAGAIAPLCASLFEPAARSLGDLWTSDDCSDLEVTLGLVRLQTSLRRLGTGAVQGSGAALPVVLVAPQPGEQHMLGAAMDAEMLWQAGWDAHAEFPTTDRALQDLVAGSWFDALDLSLSNAHLREDSLPRMARTIAMVRHASLNPALVVVVGGRVFNEQAGAGVAVGADASAASSMHVGAVTARALHPKR